MLQYLNYKDLPIFSSPHPPSFTIGTSKIEFIVIIKCNKNYYFIPRHQKRFWWQHRTYLKELYSGYIFKNYLHEWFSGSIFNYVQELSFWFYRLLGWWILFLSFSATATIKCSWTVTIIPKLPFPYFQIKTDI